MRGGSKAVWNFYKNPSVLVFSEIFQKYKFRFQCAVDMSCLVSYIQWWHQMGNGEEKKQKNPVKRVCTHNSAKSGRIKEGWLREADKYAIFVGDDSTPAFLFCVTCKSSQIFNARPSWSQHTIYVISDVLLPLFNWSPKQCKVKVISENFLVPNQSYNAMSCLVMYVL